jgi:hypothetical protein
MIKQMAQVAVECMRQPNRDSVWHAATQKYVCPKDPEYREALRQQSPEVALKHPPINPTFKLVFLTAAGGTVLFTAICVGTHIWIGNAEMTSSLDRTVTAMLDMAKIGFGAVAGMLGGRSISAT